MLTGFIIAPHAIIIAVGATSTSNLLAGNWVNGTTCFGEARTLNKKHFNSYT